MIIFKNKRGIELSINFIVMLVLAIAMFAGGLVFTSKFFSHAEQVRGTLDAQTERQIEKLLDSGSPVVLPISTKEIYRNKFDTFGLGILAKHTGEYTVHIVYLNAFKSDKSQITNVYADEWLQLPPENILNLDKNEKGKFLIGVSVPKSAEKGTYIFKVTVSFDSNEDDTLDTDEYDNPLQMIVRIP